MRDYSLPCAQSPPSSFSVQPHLYYSRIAYSVIPSCFFCSCNCYTLLPVATMPDFSSEWPQDWVDNLSVFQSTTFEENDFSFMHANNFTPFEGTTSSNSTSSYASPSRSPADGIQTPQSRKRRHGSEDSQFDALVRTRKTRRLRDPDGTAKIRKKGACILCKTLRKEVI